MFVLGSVAKGRYTASSDIDLLVALDLNADERAQLMAGVFMAMPNAPIELHITDEKGWCNWYSRFIDDLVEV
ncbi:MAG: nucleotidyltransferase domain-containing protein [Nitrososphaerota archaeon]|nr:nucleotidyltransferase domain-containing protein [Nitrososphaerota archaeon]MDG6932383.1 nucleotidyltransferase domain-containing protein [Nitrososphaerota archaeon]MDG6936851.1 nucleotidyltransferase domain-containing protein [Nitrososphaerota archaeon]MDG6945012.1 nucleotidyltransferase domain-containing protein [Nitrososphaerota archaeon]